MSSIQATVTDLPEIKELLSKSNIMIDDIEKFVSHTLVIKEQERIIAVGALELYGSEALLRSVAVDSTVRNRGLGKEIYSDLQRVAQVCGVSQLYLLTETAEAFFRKMGFETVSRDVAPESIKNTSQFSSLCPSSATLMRLSI